jgi:Type II CAAX prenyl endopeptidase Rce1-like
MRRLASPNLVRLAVICVLGFAIGSRNLMYACPGYRARVDSLPAPLPWLEQPLRWALICAIALYLLPGFSFAFGQLTAYGRLRLWPAALITGLVFGVVHLGQASVQGLSLPGQAGTVALIALGGLLFSWLFARWGRSIWPPLAVHGLLNLGWALWDFAPSPLGTVSANGLRALSVLLAVGLTWRYAPASVPVSV